MNKFYIVENIGFDTKFKTEKEIKESQSGSQTTG